MAPYCSLESAACSHEGFPIDHCFVASSVCSGLESVVLDGPASCEITSQNSNTAACDASLECELTKDVDGTVVSRSEPMLARCSSVVDTTYDCSCTTDTDSTSFQLESADTPFETCSNAALRCEEWLAE